MTLPDQFRNCIRAAITAKGVYPNHVIWRRGGAPQHFTTEGRPEYVVRLACELLLRHGASEIVFGFDVHANDMKQMGLPYRSGVVLAHWFGKWSVGLMAYRAVPLFVDEIDWHNSVAQARMRGTIERYLAERSHRNGALILPDSFHWN